LIEGPEPSQDCSYKWVLRNEKVQLIEGGITIDNFSHETKLRDLETEFRLVRKLTETKEHDANQEAFEKESSKLNRYQKLRPCTSPICNIYSQAYESQTSLEECRYLRFLY